MCLKKPNTLKRSTMAGSKLKKKRIGAFHKLGYYNTDTF